MDEEMDKIENCNFIQNLNHQILPIQMLALREKKNIQLVKNLVSRLKLITA